MDDTNYRAKDVHSMLRTIQRNPSPDSKNYGTLNANNMPYKDS